MYASFDCAAARVVHVHSDHRVVGLLAYLELPDVPVKVKFVSTPEPLWEFTELELRTMLAHYGIETSAYHTVRELAAVLQRHIAGLPHADAVYDELKAQADALPQGDKAVHKYVRGSTRAAQPQGLLDNAGPAPAPRTPSPPPRGAHTSPPAPAGPKAAPGTPGKAGGVTERINAACAAAWGAAGCPREGAALAAARKAAIGALEQQGVNSNSASKGSGIWFRNLPQ